MGGRRPSRSPHVARRDRREQYLVLAPRRLGPPEPVAFRRPHGAARVRELVAQKLDEATQVGIVAGRRHGVVERVIGRGAVSALPPAVARGAAGSLGETCRRGYGHRGRRGRSRSAAMGGRLGRGRRRIAGWTWSQASKLSDNLSTPPRGPGRGRSPCPPWGRTDEKPYSNRMYGQRRTDVGGPAPGGEPRTAVIRAAPAPHRGTAPQAAWHLVGGAPPC